MANQHKVGAGRCALVVAIGLAMVAALPVSAATVSWVPDANGFWHTATNWSSNPLLPGSADDVLIDIGGATVRTITYAQDTSSINSLLSEENLTLTGGTLTVAGGVQVNAAFTLNGGHLQGGTVQPGSGGQGLTLANNTSNKLTGTVMNANMNMTADWSRLRVEDGLTLNGTCSINGPSEFVINPDAGGQTLDGTGEIVFAWASGYTPALYVDGTTTLTLGPDLTLRGYGAIGGTRYIAGTDTIVNQGTIRAATGNAFWVRPDIFNNAGLVEANGGTLTIQSPNWSSSGTLRVQSSGSNLVMQNTWSNTGTIEVGGGTLQMQGATTTAGLGTFSRTGGTIKLIGTLDNTGDTLDLDAIGMGPLSLDGGTITGGIIAASSGSDLIPANNSSNRLVGVTMDADMDLSVTWSRIKIENDLVLNSTATVKGASEVVFQPDAGGQSLTGTGEIVFDYLSSYTPGLYIDGNTTLTIGPDITLRGECLLGGSRYISGTDTLINQGLIRADPGNPMTVRADHFTNNGTVEADNTSLILDSANGWTNASTIRAINNGTLYLKQAWSNTGTIESSNSTANLEGTMTTAGLGTFSRSGGTVKLVGTLANTAATLDPAAIGLGTVRIDGGTIVGGTVASSPSAMLYFANNTSNRFDGVTVNGPMDFTGGWARIKIDNGLTLNGTASLDSSAIFAFNASVGGQSLNGTGQIVMTWTTGNQPGIRTDGNTTLTIGPDITISGRGYLGGSGYVAGTDTLVNRGTIAVASGQSMTVQPDILSNTGIMSLSGGGSMNVSSSSSFASTGTIDVGSGSTLTLSSGASPVTINASGLLAGTGTVSGGVTNSAGTIRPGGTSVGTLTINGTCAQASAGTIELQIDSASQFDRLVVSGQLNLGGSGNGGTLSVALTGGSLAAGNSFDLLDFASVNGTFTALSLASPGTGLVWDTQNLYTTGTLLVASGVSATAWKSESIHAGSGPQYLLLDPSRTAGHTGANGPVTECRRSGLRRLVVEFSAPVEPVDGQLDTGDVVVTNSVGTPFTPSAIALLDGDTAMRIDFAEGALPTGGRYSFELAGKFRSTAEQKLLGGDTNCQVRVLGGDVNGDGAVNLIDVAAVKTLNRAAVTSASARYDLNVDGRINLIDVALAKSYSGGSAP